MMPPVFFRQNGLSSHHQHPECVGAPLNGHLNGGHYSKYRQWNSGHEPMTTSLSRHYSQEAISNGSIPNGRQQQQQSQHNGLHNGNGVITRGPGGLHEDLEFPNNIKTLSRRKTITWMRPHDICTRPLFRLSSSGCVLTSRELPEPVGPGDPNLLAAIGCLSQFPRLMERVVPPEQSFDAANGYCGMFRFRFWQWGRWIEIRVDDRLPTRDDRPAYMHCAQPDIFWVALLEKAYAKLYGGYAFLKYGNIGRAIQDLTGAVVQSVPPSAPLLGGAVPRSTLLLAISGNLDKNSLVRDIYNFWKEQHENIEFANLGCQNFLDKLYADKGTKRRRTGGLLPEHPYCVTGLARVRTTTNSESSEPGSSNIVANPNDTNLVRLRSPWAGGEYGGVWRGAWSEKSWEWNALNERDRELLASRSQHEGEFWMSVPEFLQRFTVIWLAHIGPDDWALEPALHSRAPWRAALAIRHWRAGFNAGGPHKHVETTSTNPQFRIRVPGGSPGKAHIVVAVAQKYECFRMRTNEIEPIGFTIYEVPPGLPRVTPQYVSEQMPLDFAELQNLREVVTFFALPPGDFVVLPHSIQHREGKFLLRILADQHADVWEVNEDNLVLHNLAAEFSDERTMDYKLLYKLRTRFPPEIDAAQLQQILKSSYCGLTKSFVSFNTINGPSIDLCRALLALRDPGLGGRLSIESVPSIIALIKFWKAAFRRCSPNGNGTLTLTRSIWNTKISSYLLRGLLWTGGATVSNKVLEALVSRFTRNRYITLEGYLMAMTRLHLAHERYHSLDVKAKANPLTLEEMILMTIYS